MASITLKSLSKFYGDDPALNNLTLTVADGECLVLVGPSGCGKTTTLRLIAGLEEPSEGAVFLDGKVMTGVPPWQRNLSMVLQKPALVPTRTVRENLNFPNRLKHGFFARESVKDTAAVLAVAKLLGLASLLDRKPDELSGGQLQRVALGRTFLQRPAARLLDEPLGHLDGPMRVQLRRELHLLQSRFPATMIHVTHDPEEALSLGQRVAVLERGRLQQLDTPANILAQPRHRFVAEFFQTRFGPMNFLPGVLQVEGEAWSLASAAGRWPLAVPVAAARHREVFAKNVGREVLLGVRPEDIYIQCNSSGANARPLQVLLVECVDQGCLVTCGLGELRVCAFLKQDSLGDLTVGNQVQVGFGLERAYIFDRATGLNLLPG